MPTESEFTSKAGVKQMGDSVPRITDIRAIPLASGEKTGTKTGTDKNDYTLVEVHTDAVAAGERVVIVDDQLATGGTALAAARLIEKLGGQVSGMIFLIELEFLKGRERLKGYDVFSLVKYESE